MMYGTDRWGPSDQGKRPPGFSRRRLAMALLFFSLFLGLSAGKSNTSGAISGLLFLASIGLLVLPAAVIRLRALRHPHSKKAVLPVADPLQTVRNAAWQAGGGVYLGAAGAGQSRFARPERAVLLLGPPRSGKTSSVIIPAILSHTGPLVSTSTKPDVCHATQSVRALGGRVWVFDPTGTTGLPPGATELRWSPVTAAGSWDGALLIARAMTANIGSGTTDRSHWSSRAQALLAPMLHAAAVHDRDMETVGDWVLRHELDEAGVLLEDQRCSRLAFGNLLGILHTEDRERSSIFSAAADALQAYSSEHALNASRDPNFDADAFVRSHDTVYIHAPAEAQAAAAPIVCGLLAEIRRATYQAHANSQLSGRVLFALDEVANIAPLDELPQIASEGGGQGLTLLAALQDLSQARQRWGTLADGFLTLFGTKLILPGIADTKTLESISTMLGEYDRQVVSHTKPRPSFVDAIVGGTPTPHKTVTYSTQRTRVLSGGEIANIPAGRALHLDGVNWELVTLTPAHTTEPWRTLTTPSVS